MSPAAVKACPDWWISIQAQVISHKVEWGRGRGEGENDIKHEKHKNNDQK